jgi:hypothetical protein
MTLKQGAMYPKLDVLHFKDEGAVIEPVEWVVIAQSNGRS